MLRALLRLFVLSGVATMADAGARAPFVDLYCMPRGNVESVSPGQTVDYQVHCRNAGTKAFRKPVELFAWIVNGKFTSASGAGWTCDVTEKPFEEVTCIYEGGLEPAGTAELHLTGVAQAPNASKLPFMYMHTILDEDDVPYNDRMMDYTQIVPPASK